MKINNNDKEKIITVSDYIKIVNQSLKSFRAKIIGEVSEVNFGPTGHVYFTLKDEKDNSIINCVIWKFRYDIYGIKLKQGDKIIASGYPEIYAPWGKMSFITEVIEYAGEGTLKKEYEELKKKLSKQGFFEQERKRPLPKYPQKIGVITSKQGAVLADFLNNLGKFGFKIKMIDSRVEGQAAVLDLLSAIRTFKKQEIEALVIMRGGGSLESMAAFNNESLVKEVVNFPVPVIAAIGHHKDVSLVALAADYLVSTPSIAATSLNKSWEQIISLLDAYKTNIFDFYERELRKNDLLINQSIEVIYKTKNLIFDIYKEIKTNLKISFQIFNNTIQNNKNSLNNLWEKSIFRFTTLLSTTKEKIENSEKIISLRNPETQLKLGYSLVYSNKKLIKSIKNVKIGEEANIQTSDGTIISKIKDIKNQNAKLET